MKEPKFRAIRRVMIVVASVVTMTGAFAVRQAQAADCGVQVQYCGYGGECGDSQASCQSHAFHGCEIGYVTCTLCGPCGCGVPTYTCSQIYAY